jgi:hypothetical protein
LLRKALTPSAKAAALTRKEPYAVNTMVRAYGECLWASAISSSPSASITRRAAEKSGAGVTASSRTYSALLSALY